MLLVWLEKEKRDWKEGCHVVQVYVQRSCVFKRSISHRLRPCREGWIFSNLKLAVVLDLILSPTLRDMWGYLIFLSAKP